MKKYACIDVGGTCLLYTSLSTRALAIIEILKKLNHPISSLALSEEIGCSTKTIQSEIKDINKQLKDTKIISIRGVGYKLEGKIEINECNSNTICLLYTSYKPVCLCSCYGRIIKIVILSSIF